MRSLSLIALSALLAFASSAQTAPGKYWIQFTDKANTPFSISSPSAYLSQKALDRRTAQGIAIVNNDLPVAPAYIDSVLATGIVKLLHRSKWFNAITVQSTDTAAIDTIRTYGFVADVQRVRKLTSTNDPDSDLKLGRTLVEEGRSTSGTSAFDYGNGFTQANMIKVDVLHNLGFKGQGMTIAVMDAGFIGVDSLPLFQNLWAGNHIKGGWDFVNDSAAVFNYHGHGTQVLSCMGAFVEGTLVGTAPEADYWLFRTEDTGSEYVIEEDNWVAAAERADSIGVDILHTSLGYTNFNDSTQSHTYADMDGNTTRITIGSDIAASKGMLVVCSAGNSGNNSWNFIGAPADGDSVLAIGAVDSDENYASFSSNGPSFDGRVKPNVTAMGAGTTVASLSGGVVGGNGTSFSGPVVSGAAACLWQAAPERTAMEIFKCIEESAHMFNNPDTLMGYGIPDISKAYEKLTDEPAIEVTSDSLSAWPNPFFDQLQFSFFSTDTQYVDIKVFDMQGRLLTHLDEQVIYGENSYTLRDAAYWRQGGYILKIRNKWGVLYNAKMIKAGGHR